MLVADKAHEEFLAAEAKQWDGQAPRYDEKRQRDCTYLASVEAAVEALQPNAGDLVLDAACGTGLTIRSYCQPGMRIVALDLSMESLRWQRTRLSHSDILFVRGNLLALPFAASTFSRVLCANAITQVPDEAARRDCVRELGRVAQDGGRVVVTAHNFSIEKRWQGLPKEGPAGSHSGAVEYIHRFDFLEFRDLLATVIDVERVGGAGLPLLYRFKLGPISQRLERMLRRFPMSVRWGNMLVGVGSPRRT